MTWVPRAGRPRAGIPRAGIPRAVAVALLAVLMLPTALQGVDSAAGSHVPATPTGATTPWWGPDAPDEGHHVRVAFTVRNPLDVPVESLAVRAEIDLAEELTKAGWTHTGTSLRPLLKGFHLDPDSVRVVQVSDLATGRVVTQNPDRPADQDGYDLRQVVPSLVLDRFVDDLRAGNPSTEPLLTVYWIAHDLAARGRTGDTQSFYVYLDTTTNGDVEPVDLDGTDAGAVEALHWTGAATTFYGAVPPTEANQDTPTVRLLGLHPDTTVQVFLRQGSDFKPHEKDDIVHLGEGSVRVVSLGTGAETTEFKLESDGKPFLAFVNRVGHVPSLDGGMAGRHFLLQTPTTYGNVPVTLNIVPADGGPATVRAVSPSGSQRTFEINTGASRLPYTVGLWDEGANPACYPNEVPAGTAVLNPGTVYELTADADVLVQTSITTPLQQVPTLDGGPSGTEFAFPLQETFFQGATCRRTLDSRSWSATSAAGADVFVDNPLEGRIDPTGADAIEVPAAPAALAPRTNNGGLRDRPVFLHADDDVTVWAGALDGDTVGTSGPLASDGGLAASGLGEATLFAYHDETTARLTVERFVSGVESRDVFLSEGDSFEIAARPGGDEVTSWSLTADRPVVAYGLAARPGFLAGLPLTAHLDEDDDASNDALTIEGTEYRGYLLDVGSADGIEPQTRATTAGESVTYRFTVTNMARSASGDLLSDTADLEALNVPDGWEVDLETTSISLAPGASEVIAMTVTPPDDAKARTTTPILLQATSGGNPALSVTSGTATYIRSNYDVGAWFDQEDGDRTKEVTGSQGDVLPFRVVVKNEGTAVDSIEVALEGAEEGWDVAVTRVDDGQPISQATLEGDESLDLDLVVTPPADLADGLLVLHLTATSGTQPSAFDTITAIARVKAPADVEATAETLSDTVLPGEEATFPITVTNSGTGGIELDLDVAGDLPEGWSEPALFFVHPTTGERTPIDGLNVGPDESLGFVLTTTAPADALAGELATVRALARSSGGAPVFELAFTAAVGARHDLSVAPSASPLVARVDGEPTPFRLQVGNDGNLDEVLRVEAADLPAGWSLAAPGATAIERTKSATLELALEGPVGVAAGTFDAVLRLRSEDGTATELLLPVVVPDANGLAVVAGDVEPAQPGRAALLPLTVVNAGNAPATVTVVAPDGETWEAVAPADATTLRPGASRVLDVGWLVPAEARSGDSDHALRVVLEREDGGRVTETVAATLVVDRPRLTVDEPSPTSAPGGTLVVAAIQNEGNRTAHDVRVRLLAGDTVVDEVTLGALTPGDEAVVSLLDPERHGDLRVRVDGAEAGGSIERTLSVAGNVGAPGVGPALLVVGLALAAWVTRRSRS